MKTRLFHLISYCSFALVFLSSSHILAQNTGQGSEQNPGQAQGQVADMAFDDQMRRLHESLRIAQTNEERKSIQAQIRELFDQERAAHPPKKLNPEEIAARKIKLEEQLKKDPVGWQRYQLMEQMRSAKTMEERKGIETQIRKLDEQAQAAAEAKLTPEQRAARQVRQEKIARMRQEMKPLFESLRNARTNAERKAIEEQIRAIEGKHR